MTSHTEIDRAISFRNKRHASHRYQLGCWFKWYRGWYWNIMYTDHSLNVMKTISNDRNEWKWEKNNAWGLSEKLVARFNTKRRNQCQTTPFEIYLHIVRSSFISFAHLTFCEFLYQLIISFLAFPSSSTWFRSFDFLTFYFFNFFLGGGSPYIYMKLLYYSSYTVAERYTFNYRSKKFFYLLLFRT